MSTELKTIEARLKSHDWWFHMSDDGNAFRRGEAASKRLMQMCKAAGASSCWPTVLAVRVIWR
jgi:hypothetical protein